MPEGLTFFVDNMNNAFLFKVLILKLITCFDPIKQAKDD